MRLQRIRAERQAKAAAAGGRKVRGGRGDLRSKERRGQETRAEREACWRTLNLSARGLTIIYYFRVLVLRWVHIRWPRISENGTDVWAINLNLAPDALTCVWILLGVSLVATLSAGLIFSNREFRLKTPEGS